MKSYKVRLDNPTLKTIVLNGNRDENIEILNLLSGGDISKDNYDDICEAPMRYSKGIAKHGKGLEYISTTTMKWRATGVTMVELPNLLNNFNIDISIISTTKYLCKSTCYNRANLLKNSIPYQDHLQQLQVTQVSFSTFSLNVIE